MTQENRPHLLCRIFGHRWRASHRLAIWKDGARAWIYTDHVCLRCYMTDWRLPAVDSKPLGACGLESWL